jgi:pimeloyl-ACP methyl ester carboxylesterase
MVQANDITRVPQPVSRVERHFALDSVEIAGDEYPAGDPRGTAILLHGGGQTRHSWKGTARSIASAGWTAVAVDARGHGDSQWPASADYSIDALADDLRQIAQHYPDPVLIGASMGGMTALVAVGEGRVRARGLIIVDVAPKIEAQGVARIREFMRANLDGFASLADVAAAISAYNPHRARPATEAGLRRNVRLHEDGRWYWHWDPAFMRISDDEPRRLQDPERLRAAARNVQVPTLLVRGAQSDVLSEEGVRDFQALVPHARFTDVGEAGHMVAGDDNDAFAQAAVDFLNSL